MSKQSQGAYRDEQLRSFYVALEDDLDAIISKDKGTSFAVSRLKERARKRASFRKPELRAQAINSFIEINQLVGDVKVSLDPWIIDNAKLFITRALEQYTLTHYEESIQTPLELDLLNDFWKYGPGASNGVSGTHACQKIIQPMTCTDRAMPFVVSLRNANPYFRSYDGHNGNSGCTLIKGSRLSTVPKNEETERTIAIEPSGNMALQLAAGMYLEGALRYIGLDISSQQDKNKLAACRGSITNSLATIDMKSASDMISPELVRLLMPDDWYQLLIRIRSDQIEVPGVGWLKLNMISTMGNGFTFPLMTLILTALIYANRCKTGPALRIDWKDTCVFGDDIIVPTTEYHSLCTVLSQAGLIVNTDKSFSDGPFRESCGGDYYNGYDVTPVYVKSIYNLNEIYVALNQLLVWSANHDVWLPKSISFLKQLLSGRVFLIPEWHNPDQGILCSSGPVRYKYLSYTAPRRKVKPSIFDVMLAVGGYIEQIGPSLFYSPRSERTEGKTRKLRIPKGYRSGWDPIKRSQKLSRRISMRVDVLLQS